ncbi:protein YhaL [Escherichia coli]
MSKKSAKKRQPVKPVVAKEPIAPPNFGYEEMLSELEAIVADAETRLAEDEATA